MPSLLLLQMVGYAVMAVLGVMAGLSAGLWVMRRIRLSNRVRTGAVLAAALFSFVTYQDPADRAPLEASESESRRKKDKGSGAPPDSG